MLEEPHIRPLAGFVEAIRKETGRGPNIPQFDPLDGGILASKLILLEAPGPQAVKTGFISRNNPGLIHPYYWDKLVLSNGSSNLDKDNHWETFKAALYLWKLIKGYDSSFEGEV